MPGRLRADGTRARGSSSAKDGRYSFGFGPIRAIIALLAIVSLLGVPYTVLMPILRATCCTADRGRSAF